MGSVRWIGGFLGWVSGGAIGALIGYLLGSAVDGFIDTARQLTGGSSQQRGGTYTGGQGSGYGGQRTGYGGSYSGSQRSTYSQQSSSGSRGYTASEQRNSFFVSLLVLSSAVIRADGQTHPAELQTVRKFFRTNFGEQAATQAMDMLGRLNSQQVNIYQVGDQIAANMNYSQRLQLFHYLVSIATADGDFSASEKSILEAIGRVIRLNDADTNSIISMSYKGDTAAYTVLEISPSATDDEVKAAYRRMAMKHHPDKVATLGPEVQKAAEEKFRKIQEAYETIKRQRGLN